MKKTIIKTSIAFVAFIVWTILVCFCDVQPDASGAHTVGLASMNLAISNSITRNEACSVWADVFMIIAFVGLGGLAIIGFVQIIKTKSLRGVQPLFYGTLAVGILWIICYLMFDKIAIINYAPLPASEYGYKSSYPSTHVICCIFSLSILIRYASSKNMNKKLTITCYVFEALIVAGVAVMKLFAKEHYLSDLIGGAILGIFYVFLVDLWVVIFESRHGKYETVKEGE